MTYRGSPRRHINNMYSHRACMAHIESPIFCPNHTPPLSFTGANLHSATTAHSHDTQTEYDDNENNDDDEPGGVPLESPDHSMTDAHYETPTTRTNDVHFTIPQIYANSSAPASIASDTRTHPRPETRDLWEEGDGRRVRFALEGEPPHDPPRFDMLAAISHAFEHQRTLHHILNGPPSVAPAHVRVAPRTSTDTQTRLQDALPLGQTPPIRHIDEMDDDALGVDDPRRSYDFAESMDLWRLRSIRDKRLPSFEPGLQSSVRLGRPIEAISRSDVSSGKTDIQGIRWDLIGPERKRAIAARTILHPSRCHSKSSSQKQIGTQKEHQYRFRSFSPSHKAKSNHYQLRNVLAASSRNEIFYSTGREVVQASLSCPNESTTVLDLTKPSNFAADFRITCLSTSKKGSLSSADHILIAGGFNGEYAVLNLDNHNDNFAEGHVTHAYNGLVTHVHSFADRLSGLTRAAFCSNDRKVQLMDIRSLQFTDSFSYENAINCSTTSPDGRLRVLAGDSREVLITDAERGYPLVTLKEHNDHCFACDWSPDSRYVAAAGQDGKTVIWDARNWTTPWNILDCVTSCARSLNFTDSGALVVAENDDIVSVYEGPLYQRRQDIRFFGAIAGVALLDGGAEIAIANADKTVGGLLTFEQASFGHGNGSYGKQVRSDDDHQSYQRRRRAAVHLRNGCVIP